MVKPSTTAAWKTLLALSDTVKRDGLRISDLFHNEPDRFNRFSLQHDDLLLDYSKNLLTRESFEALIDLARECEVPAAIAAMFAGDRINHSENRAALHVALRDPANYQEFGGIEATLRRMDDFVHAVHSGAWLGSGGERITDVVNIGIGGSNLGPVMVNEALADFATGQVNTHFVSNVDPTHLHSTLAGLRPESTLFIVASKSFTTLETRQNGAAARRWLLRQINDEAAVARHFVAISSNPEAVTDFGIDATNMFPMWDWVGGRYSLWSAIGLPIALSLGMDNFRQLLAGAQAMDRHFREAELHRNMPLVMALLTVWYTGFFDCHSSAVVPYSQRLRQLPAFLQQLCMESLGKSVDVTDQAVTTNTGEVLWGSAGTDGQHSYFQLLHQGTEFIPVDFIAVGAPGVPEESEAHRHLLANCLSQSLALMEGRPDAAAPCKEIPGNKPSNTLLLNSLSPYNLGSLIALYEHKVYVQSVIWNINAFDQWGVELGKQLSRDVFEALQGSGEASGFDDSTANLIRRLNQSSERPAKRRKAAE